MKFIFTFGSGQKNEGRAQPIIAEDILQAREKMISVYGIKWGFCYSEEEWVNMKNDPHRLYPLEKLLPEL